MAESAIFYEIITKGLDFTMSELNNLLSARDLYGATPLYEQDDYAVNQVQFQLELSKAVTTYEALDEDGRSALDNQIVEIVSGLPEDKQVASFDYIAQIAPDGSSLEQAAIHALDGFDLDEDSHDGDQSCIMGQAPQMF